MKPDIADAVHTIDVARKLSGPVPPENPLARLIADSPESATELPREVVIAREHARREAALRRHRHGKKGFAALLDAIKNAAK